MNKVLCEDREITPQKFDSAGTHVYTPPSNHVSTYIPIVGDNPAHLLDSDHDTLYEGRELESGKAP